MMMTKANAGISRGCRRLFRPVIIVLFVISVICYRQITATDGSGGAENAPPSIAFVILTQPTAWHEENTRRLRNAIYNELPNASVFDTVKDFHSVKGAWAIWPLLTRLRDQLAASPCAWLFFCEDGTNVKISALLDFLQNYDPDKPLFIGHALRDQTSTIIHHFAFVGENASRFAYPDFSVGLAMSWPMLEKIVQKLKAGEKPRDFSIDAQHELAMLVWEDGLGIDLIDSPLFCTTIISSRNSASSCITDYAYGDYHKCDSPATSGGGEETRNDEIIFAVKTFHEFHKTRIVVVKRTWAMDARNIEYFSDQEDHYIPTITLGVENTKFGHCEKTISILRRFAEKYARKMKWLVIADDDTLLSVPRLIRLLNCYDHRRSLIIGAIYGFGFDANGDHGYGYPTGGPGMIFSASAALLLADQCKCPTLDSPDDMIIGMCAQSLDIPLIHSAALHQARPNDYAVDYLARTKPISFHKHWEVDPYVVYQEWLTEPPNDESSTKKDAASNTVRSDL